MKTTFGCQAAAVFIGVREVGPLAVFPISDLTITEAEAIKKANDWAVANIRSDVAWSIEIMAAQLVILGRSIHPNPQLPGGEDKIGVIRDYRARTGATLEEAMHHFGMNKR